MVLGEVVAGRRRAEIEPDGHVDDELLAVLALEVEDAVVRGDPQPGEGDRVGAHGSYSGRHRPGDQARSGPFGSPRTSCTRTAQAPACAASTLSTAVGRSRSANGGVGRQHARRGSVCARRRPGRGSPSASRRRQVGRAAASSARRPCRSRARGRARSGPLATPAAVERVDPRGELGRRPSATTSPYSARASMSCGVAAPVHRDVGAGRCRRRPRSPCRGRRGRRRRR